MKGLIVVKFPILDVCWNPEYASGINKSNNGKNKKSSTSEKTFIHLDFFCLSTVCWSFLETIKLLNTKPNSQSKRQKNQIANLKGKKIK